MSSPYNDVRERLRSDFEATGAAFHSLLASFSEQGWDVPSHNPGWTNGQLLFHIAFAFMLVPPLCRIMRLFGSVPRRWSKRFAALLDASTPVFNRVNAGGPRIGARLYRGDALGRKYDRVQRAIRKHLDAVRDEDWARGMYYPRQWDPRFGEYATFEELFRYPIIHFEHHVAQLRASA